jgi:hypothetical protein
VKYSKVKFELGAILTAGAVLAACGATVNTVKTSTPAKPATGITVGFNASKSAFVLPYRLGNLPAPELVLARSDPAYAAALTAKSDWIDVKQSKGQAAAGYGYFFMGGATPKDAGQMLSAKTIASSLRAMVPSGVDVTAISPISIHSSQLGSFSLNSSAIPKALQSRLYEVVTPTVLEIRAAPVGSLSVHGASTPAICVPSPEALIRGNKAVTPRGMSSITSGPDTIFASSPATTIAPTEYTQGTSTCANFS